MVKLIIKSVHKALLKKIIYKWKKYCLKSYKNSYNIKLYKVFVYSLLLVIPIYPIFTNFSDKYDNKTDVWDINYFWKNDIYIDNPLINSLLIKIISNKQLIDPQIYSLCQNNQRLLSKNEQDWKYEYLINLNIKKNCSCNNIYIKNGETIYIKTLSRINLLTFSSLFDEFTNYSDSKIKKLIKLKNSSKIWLPLYETIRNNQVESYKKSILNLILKKRQNLKYIIPVVGKELPTTRNIIPNAGRPYRANYTDGIHHWWDIFATRWTPVRALWDGIIYRIRNDFCWESFDKILWKNLTNNDRLINLDVYRWNQVWIKTYDGNITIYAHLENIPKNIYEWKVIKSSEYLGDVGRSWVPDKEYTDFHLHFEIQINPHAYKSNTLLDVMQWPFFGKWKKYDDLIEWQNKLFVK